MTASSEISAADAAALLDDLTALVARASTLIRAIAAKGLTHRLKDDLSPVTAADEVADALVVDPLDGTKEFLTGSDQFTVNLGIVSGGVPLAGVVAAPNRGAVWRGVVGGKAERLRLTDDGADQARTIRTRRWPEQNAVALMSRSHLDPATEAFLTRLEPIERQPSGSAIKFCQIAEGAADVYPRLATVCEWDVAAGQALLTAAGGIVTNPNGGPLAYGRVAENFRVAAFVAWGDPEKCHSVMKGSVTRS